MKAVFPEKIPENFWAGTYSNFKESARLPKQASPGAATYKFVPLSYIIDKKGTNLRVAELGDIFAPRGNVKISPSAHFRTPLRILMGKYRPEDHFRTPLKIFMGKYRPEDHFRTLLRILMGKYRPEDHFRTLLRIFMGKYRPEAHFRTLLRILMGQCVFSEALI